MLYSVFINLIKFIIYISSFTIFLCFLKKYAIGFFFNISVSNSEREIITKEFKQKFETSKLNHQEKILGIFTVNKLPLLIDIKDFYEKEVQIYYKEYNDFLKKIENLFKMFTFPITIYSGCIAYLIKNNAFNETYKITLMLISLLIYFYFLIRIIWIQSFQNAYQLLKTELPIIKCKNREQYLKNYIYNNALILKLNKENLQRLKMKIKWIHLQYIISSSILIISIIIIYVTK